MVDGRGGAGREIVECGDQRIDSRPIERIDFDDRSAFEERTRHLFLQLEVGEFAQVVVGESDLCQRHHPVFEAQQFEDPQVLLALWLPSFGRGNDEHAGIDCSDAGQHVLQKSNVAGNVDERNAST